MGAPRWKLHVRHAASQGGQTLGRLDTDEGLDGFPEEVGLVHVGVGNSERLFVKCVIQCDRSAGRS